ncbi:hypothetical protein ASG65_14925 [Bacillus sp. Leaf13]|nr:hypothetical protein ASG65_14925 [Bacillus sp. Leaf13]
MEDFPQYGVSTNRIVRINGLENPYKLVIGLALLIPEPYLQYRVQQGDTLEKIANQFGTTVQEIMQTNRITNPSTIYPGQRLTIPVIYYTVRERDTLYDIARRYGTTVQAIMKTNRITDPSSIYMIKKRKFDMHCLD